MGVTVAGFALGIGFQQARIANLTAEHEKYKREMVEKTAASYEALITYQTAVDAHLTKLRNTHNDTVRQIQVNYNTAESGRLDLIERLRKLSNSTAGANKQTETDGKRGPSEYDSATFDLLFRLFDRHSKELVEVGEYADKLKAAGLTCEGNIDSWSGQSPSP